jgi:hypothetical protein
MLRKVTTALAAMLVLGSLATAHAEDPDADVIDRTQAFVEHAPPAPARHVARSTNGERHRVTYQR